MDRPKIRSFLDGFVSGSVGILISHPFDTIKTYIQNNKVVPKNISSLYKGLTPPLLGVGFEKAIVFGVYTNAYNYLNLFNTNEISKNTLAGGLAGLSASLVVTPVERIKILLQNNTKITQINSKYLFRGFSATLTRETPGFAIYFNVYEGLKHKFYSETKIPVWSSFLFGGTAGGLAWVFIYPQDCIKTRMQSSDTRKTFVTAIRDVYREGGLKRFYKGFHFALMRAIPLHAGTFMTMEVLKNQSAS